MFTVTFYSYKGGVGRTLALANVAYALAGEGSKARVVVVDFDLEAPGIDTIAPFDSAKRTKKGGVVEYIEEYDTSPEPSPDALPSLLPYAKQVDGIPDLILIPAGKKDERYQKTLTCLNWERFYRLKQGYRFFEQFKGKIQQEFAPDYLLVDSRTGLADVAGITTHQLADLVVLVFNLNRQNLDGIKKCYHSIVSAPRPRPVKIMLVASPVPQGQLLDSRLLESRLDEASKSMPEVVSYSRTGSDPIIQIPYLPALALMDVAFVQSYPAEEISKIYRRLAEAIQKSNPAEMKFLLERAFRYWSENRFEEAEEEFRTVIEQHPDNAEGHYLYADFITKRKTYKEAMAQLEEACRLEPDNARYLYALGTALAGLNRNEDALNKLKRAEELDSSKGAILRGISRLYNKMGDSTKALEYWRKINQAKPPAGRLERLKASQRFAAMVPEFLSASLNLPGDFDRNGFVDRLEKAVIFDYATKAGILESALKQELSSQQIRELDDLLRRQEKDLSGILGEYFATIQMKVRQGELHHFLHEGDLERLVKNETGTSANAFRLCLALVKMNGEEYRQAVDTVSEAMKAKIPESGQRPFYRVWGDAIAKLGEQTTDTASKVGLFREAADKYAKASEMKPDDPEALYDWGTALGKLSDFREGSERVALLEGACEKFAKAVEIKPDKHGALYNWGLALGKLSGLREGSERAALLQDACEKYAKALEIKPDKHEALNNWGGALGRLSYLHEGRQRMETIEAAFDKAKRAEELKPGAGIYNMACFHALLGRKKRALAALKKAVGQDPQHKEKAAKDEDFRSLWDDEAFKAIVAT